MVRNVGENFHISVIPVGPRFSHQLSIRQPGMIHRPEATC